MKSQSTTLTNAKLRALLVCSIMFATIAAINQPLLASTLDYQPLDARPSSIAASGTIHAVISINGNTALVAFPDKTGNGTLADPYVIKDFNIDGFSSPCISITGVTLPLVIKDCLFYATGMGAFGIAIVSCTNVTITNNRFSNFNTGISIGASSFIKCTKNNLTITSTAMSLDSSHNNTLEQNVMESQVSCIFMTNCGDNILRGNDLSLPTGSGPGAIFIQNAASQGNNITGNSIHDCNPGAFAGIRLSYASKTIISNNTIKTCSPAMLLISSTENKIAQNTILNFSQNAIVLDMLSNNNVITTNIIESQTIPGHAIYILSAVATNITCNLIRFVQVAITLGAGASWTIVAGNVLYNNTYALSIGGSNNAVRGNDVSSTTANHGIFLGPGTALDFDGNYWANYTTKYPAAVKSADGTTWMTPYVVDPTPGYVDNAPRVNHTDTDGDGLTNYYELITSRTSPCSADTDGDGSSDGQEIAIGTNPLDPSDFPILWMKPLTFYMVMAGVAGVTIAAVAISVKVKRGKSRKGKATTKADASPKKGGKGKK
jgi:parallel beta-helix repeat protein